MLFNIASKPIPCPRCCSVVVSFLADKRRIAENVAAFARRQDFFPVEPERVAAMDVRGFFERQALVKLAEGFGHFQVHLVVHQPERDFGNPRRPFANFNAVKLVHIHLRQPVDFVQR